MLTKKEINNFDKLGFIVKEDVFSPAEVSDILKYIKEIETNKKKYKEALRYYDEKNDNIFIRMENFIHVNEALYDICIQKTSNLVKLVSKAECCLFKEKLNYKYPFSPEDKLHQDLQVNWGDYAGYFITVAIMLDDNTLDNACLHVLTNEEKYFKKALGNKWKPLSFFETKLTVEDFSPIECSAGSVMLFDWYVPHFSLINKTQKPRRNLYLTFNKQSEGDHREEYYKDKICRFPPNDMRAKDKTYEYKV